MQKHAFTNAFLILSSIFLISTTSTSLAKEEWLELRSDHFILRTNTDAEVAQSFIEEAERFRAILVALIHLDDKTDTTPPLLIYGFSKTRDYSSAIKVPESLGIYVPDLAGPKSFITLESPKEFWRPTGAQILRHEYFHHIIHQYSPIRYPRWYNEGMADYVSTMRFREDGLAILGEPVGIRLFSLKNFRWLSYEKILNAKGNYLTGTRNGVDDISMQYAQGWFLTQYIYGHDGLAKQLSSFLEELDANSETKASIVFEKHFNFNTSELDRRVKEYWEQQKLSSYGIADPNPTRAYTIKVRAMSEDESKLQKIEAGFLSTTLGQKNSKARKSFENALKQGIRPIEMNKYLARIALAQEKYEAAEVYVKNLQSLEPESADSLYYEASLRRARLMQEAKRDQSSELADIRSLLRKAILKNNHHAPAWAELAISYSDHDGTINENEAITAFQTVRALRSGNADIELSYSRLLAKMDRFDEAEVLLTNLISWSEHRRQERDLKKELEALQKQREVFEAE